MNAPLLATGIYFLTVIHGYDPFINNPVEVRRTQAINHLFSDAQEKIRRGKNYFYSHQLIALERENSLETSEILVLYFFFLSPEDCQLREHFADVNLKYGVNSKKIIIANKTFVRYDVNPGELDVPIWQRTA